MESPLLFVYGTLLSTSPHPLAEALRRGAVPVGGGFLPGRLVDLDGYPGAVPPAAPGDLVRGEIHRLVDPGLLDLLDAYEEAGPSGSGCEYVREEAEVRLEDGTVVRAWMYRYAGSTEGRRILPGGRWYPEGAP